MDISHAQRAEAALTQMLVSVADCSAADLRRDLETSKAIGSKLAAYQARAAAALAALERHGDGGAGVLRHATGVSRRRAQSQARTARVLEDMPAVREALEDGRVTFANAARLAQAAEGTGSGAVEADASLLANAESMTDDRFAREARRWTASHQRDDGEADYHRRRARRWLRLWDGDDGMTQLRGELDPVTGERIRNRLEAEARRLRRSAGRGGDSEGGGGGEGEGKLTFPQAMADSLDGLTAIGSSVGGFAGDGDPNSRGNGSASGDASRADNGSTEHNPVNRDSNDTSRADNGSTEHNPVNDRTDSANGAAGGSIGTGATTGPADTRGAAEGSLSSAGIDRADGSAREGHTGGRSSNDTGSTDGAAGGSVGTGASAAGTGNAIEANSTSTGNSHRDGAARAREGSPNSRRSDEPAPVASHRPSDAREGDPNSRRSDDADNADPAAEATSGGSRRDNGAGGGSGDTRDRRTSGSGDSDCSCGRRKASARPIADIAVVSHVDSATGNLVSQLATGEPLPPSVLEMLTCNAAITGVLYDTAGTPLWRGTTKRTATAAQLKALIARDGGCVGCGCHPALCQAHHIRPASQGGPTTISNMVLLCWYCHQRVHHNQWTVARRHGRFEVLPPVRTRWGPARAP